MKNTLDWSDLRGSLMFGAGKKATPKVDTPFSEYIERGGYREPSHRWPYSHVKPLLTKKFAEWLLDQYPEKAKSLGLEKC